jgi:uncharacterized protein YdhG (YjbR/CyaY superfamily)
MAQPTAKRPRGKAGARFSDEERAAMKDYVRELKRGNQNGESDVLEKIAEMQESDRALAERIHAIVKDTAPDLTPRTWYGMPAYARDGKVVCFFQSGEKFKSRYATLGFSDKANLDDGKMWPTAFAITTLTPAVETQVAALVKQAAS